MAKRIKIGAPVNDAEVWGFDLVEAAGVEPASADSPLLALHA